MGLGILESTSRIARLIANNVANMSLHLTRKTGGSILAISGSSWSLSRAAALLRWIAQCVSEVHLGVRLGKSAGRCQHRTCAPNFRVNMIFCVAGFRPGWRGPFVSAKGPKTIDAPSGLIQNGGTQALGGRTNSPGSNKARQRMRASLP